MSRAFVNEDAEQDKAPDFRLPDRESPYFDEAAAWAFIQSADEGDSRAAEVETGYQWGDAALIDAMEKILTEAEAGGEDRVAQLARRFLKVARAG